jgi:hypothetical protein
MPFTSRREQRADRDLDSAIVNRSPNYYLPHCKLETLAEVKRRNDPKELILISNMECNGYDQIVTTTKGLEMDTAIFGKNDVLLTGVKDLGACRGRRKQR